MQQNMHCQLKILHEYNKDKEMEVKGKAVE